MNGELDAMLSLGYNKSINVYSSKVSMFFYEAVPVVKARE